VRITLWLTLLTVRKRTQEGTRVLVHPGHKYFLFCNNKKVSCQAFGELAYEFGEHLMFVNITLRRKRHLMPSKRPPF